MAMKTLNPYLFVDDCAAAIAWYCAHLGAIETLRLPGRDRSTIMHASLEIGDSILMLSDVAHDWSEAPATGEPSSANLMLYVEDVEATQARCIENGATELMPIGDKFWGYRMGKIRDPFGHVWILATDIDELSAEEMVERAKAARDG